LVADSNPPREPTALFEPVRHRSPRFGEPPENHSALTPRAQFNFHAGYYNYFGFWEVITPQWTYQMYQQYPDDVKAWVDAHHAMDQIRLTAMRQPEVGAYVPSCRTRAASDAVAASLPDRY
jgi:hypothetical protein